MHRVWLGYWVILGLLPVWGMAAVDSSVRLEYHVDEPVLQRSRVSVDITQHKPDKTVSVSAYQEANAQLQLKKQPRETPYVLLLTLNQLRVGLDTDKTKISFDSASDPQSPLLSELSKVIGEPIELTIGDNLQIQSSSPEFQKLMKDLRQLGGFTLSNLFSEMVQQLFALTDKPLRIGQSYSRQLKLGSNGGAPITLTYKVVGISPDEVRATVVGKVPEASIQLPKGALGVESSAAMLKVSGSIDGKAVWSRKNALIYKTKIDYVYSGVIAEGGHEWPFTLRMNHSDSTRPQ